MALKDSGGYRGAGMELLSKHGIAVGDSIKVSTADGEMSGVLMPRYDAPLLEVHVRQHDPLPGHEAPVQHGRYRFLRHLVPSIPRHFLCLHGLKSRREAGPGQADATADASPWSGERT